MNKYPLWKYALLLIIIILGLIYGAPNLFGEDPAVQVTATSKAPMDDKVEQNIKDTLKTQNLPYKSFEQLDPKSILIRFPSAEVQLRAKDVLKATLGEDYTVALNLAARTPAWLDAFGAKPMKLGLDLRGGVHFLLAIDVDSLIESRLNGDRRGIGDEMRSERIRYADLAKYGDNQILLKLRNSNDLQKATSIIAQRFPDLQAEAKQGEANTLILTMTPTATLNAQNYAVAQTTTILRNRINELGVAEPVVQRQGADRISVDLPGVQDTARAKQILGGTATLEFHLADVTNDPREALDGNVPAGAKLYKYDGMPYLLKDRVILSGTSITDANSTIAEDGRPAVNIRLGGGGEAMFYRITRDNVGKPLGIVYVETKLDSKLVDGKVVYTPRKTEKVIMIANIKSALPSNFQITGISDPKEARDLALMLRAGALPAPISIIEESTVGPSLGKENISKGVDSVVIGFVLIILFMAVYYRLFGLIANLALVLDLILLVALLSVIGATLTLPGIAAIVLTVGMAVDANVLIFERIREELRNGMPPQASIQAGYERALSTIIDSNVTTLIAAIAMFAIGTGAVKGFATTLTLGLITSMYSTVVGTRALVNLIYGRRSVKHLSIGIKVDKK
ncbi:MAG: protein translocase subunit SecD [Legionellales bacterium]|nr:protein translocase subunit SecD [Legionellales bacterium]|tara:strand:+ start:1362 stop:3233 length:1872 start_codon:yes stop_codon:yes gene_type:complete